MLFNKHTINAKSDIIHKTEGGHGSTEAIEGQRKAFSSSQWLFQT